MTLTPQEAAAALADISRAEGRSAAARGYERSAPQLLLWGGVWAAGFGLTDFLPQYWGAVWAALLPLGVVCGALLGRRTARSLAPAAMALSLTSFIAATIWVLGPASREQIAAFVALAAAHSYIIMGVWRGPRLAVAGSALAALTLGGYCLLPAHFLLYMAAVGGGGLAGAGLWLRRI